MTVTVVDVAVIAGCVALVTAFVCGLFVGARLTHSAGGGRRAERPVAKAEVGELALQLLREALEVMQEYRKGQSGGVGRPELPPTRRDRRRR
jgi:hypothetical protein